MLTNFLRVAFRSLTKRKGYAALNIFGLAAGMVCCLLIFEYVSYERSYESFNRNADRIFRVEDVDHYVNGSPDVPCAAAMPGLAPAILREIPEVEEAGRFFQTALLLENTARNEKSTETLQYADPSIVDLFQLSFMEGNPKTALEGPGTAIISKTEARRFFGQEDPLGKTLTARFNGSPGPLQITGVFRDYPLNSHVRFNILVSYTTFSKINGDYGKPDDPTETSFGWTDFYSYVKLRKGADPKAFEAKLKPLIDRHYNDLPEDKENGDWYTLPIISLKDIHLYSHLPEEVQANGDGQSVAFLFLIAFFIIGIAWVNYVNLATARSLERAREVGVRKVLGALRRELIRQFMLESFLLNLLALAVAMIVIFLVNPVFGHLAGRPLGLFFSLPTIYWAAFAGVFATGTILSGLYPALVLSRYRPVTVLKGRFKNAAGGQWLRKVLIVGQFTASLVLMVGTLIVYRQMRYMRNQRLGADISQTVVLQGANGGLQDSAYLVTLNAFKADAMHIGGVKGVTASSNIMGQEILWSTDWVRKGEGSKQGTNLFMLGVDDDFIPNFGLKLVAGRAFSSVFGTEKRSIILNQTAVRDLGYRSPQEAIGKMLAGGQTYMDSMVVVGVIADFHNESLQKAIQALVLLPNRNIRHNYSVKVRAGSEASVVAGLKGLWNRYFPDDPFSYFFLDEFFNRQYVEDQRMEEVFGLFSALAIAIACFGLLGLSAYNVLQRTKEIGIRKVLGASVRSLLVILSKDFMALVGLAFLIAAPLAWMTMDRWLDGFAYRTTIGWWVFAVAGLLAGLIALVTVGGMALRVALENPVKHLRTE